MRLMIRGRGQGKTDAILKWWLNSPETRVIITADHIRAERLKREALTHRLPKHLFKISDLDPYILTVTILDHFRYGRPNIQEIGIDDLDAVLPQLIRMHPATIDLVTVTAQVL